MHPLHLAIPHVFHEEFRCGFGLVLAKDAFMLRQTTAVQGIYVLPTGLLTKLAEYVASHYLTSVALLRDRDNTSLFKMMQN